MTLETGKNKLYYSDNFDVLPRYVKDESVDLIYLDSPFNSRQSYNVLFAEKDGSKSSSQVHAFVDTWEWNIDAQRCYEYVLETIGGPVAAAMRAFWTYLGTTDIMAYLAMMSPRLVELKRVLKETGSIYLHCDPTASHYLKIWMTLSMAHRTSYRKSFGSGAALIVMESRGGNSMGGFTTSFCSILKAQIGNGTRSMSCMTLDMLAPAIVADGKDTSETGYEVWADARVRAGVKL